MRYQQMIEKNCGVPKGTNLKGYRELDGIKFDLNEPTNQMMKLMSVFLEYYLRSCTIQPKTMLDVGSGSGGLGYYMKTIFPDLEIVSVDGNPGILSSPLIADAQHFVVRTDKEYRIVDEVGETAQFDLITCFEHIEHIAHEEIQQFINNIEAHSHQDTLFLGTISGSEFEDGEEDIHCNIKTAQEWKSFYDAGSFREGGGMDWEFVDINKFLYQCKSTLEKNNNIEAELILRQITDYLSNTRQFFLEHFHKFWFENIVETKRKYGAEAYNGWVHRFHLGTVVTTYNPFKLVDDT